VADLEKVRGRRIKGQKKVAYKSPTEILMNTNMIYTKLSN
jgi:hypothetical protein